MQIGTVLKVEHLKTEYKTNPLGIGTSKPRLSWIIKSEQRDLVQTAYQIVCSKSGSEFNNDKLIWNSGKVESCQSVHVKYMGTELKSSQKIFWKVKIWINKNEESDWSETASWEMGLLNQSDWKANWIETNDEENYSDSTPCPFFRKEFNAEKDIAKATIYISARGLYELIINGSKVSDRLFTPGWTSYQQRIQYQSYNVTSMLHKGQNAIGAILGDGWYRGYLIWQGNKNTYGEKTALIAQLHLTYADGSEEILITDKSWKSSTGPILKSDIYNGETFDARIGLGTWNQSGFNDSVWLPVKESNYLKEVLVADEGEPVRITERIKPIQKIITPKGEIVFDFGQNMVGWVQFSLKGKRGDKITLRHAEVLDQDGNFYLDNIREAKAEDTYIFKGEDVETWAPRFTFHGFRYVRIENYQSEITLADLEGQVVHSDMESIGHFECSDPLINQLQHNIQWGLRGNFLDVPTDCPQRDERLGWTGDAQVFAPTAAFNFQTAPFYTKWMKDFPVEQKADGSVPWVVPNVVPNGGGTGWSDGFGATGWADAAIVIPWQVYLTYDDKEILKSQYKSMQAWEEYMIKHSGDRYIFDYGFHFGDWLSFAEYMSYQYNAPDYGYAGAYTEKELIATAYFYYSTGLMQKISTIIGKEEDAKKYAVIRPKIKSAFQKEFMTSTGRLTSNSQTAYILALSFGLYNDDMIEIGANRLANDVKHFEHLTTGFLGTPLICQSLSDNGYTELAYQLLFNKRYPSWLYPITKGATTIWERWDGIKPDGSFQDAGMNSFNHYAYGAVGEWLYTHVAGLRIDPENPGYKHFIVKPLLDERLSYATAKYKSMYGQIVVHWEKSDDELKLKIEVPANTTATVCIPMIGENITENGILINEAKSIQISGLEKKYFEVEVGSGNYIFEVN